MEQQLAPSEEQSLFLSECDDFLVILMAEEVLRWAEDFVLKGHAQSVLESRACVFFLVEFMVDAVEERA